MWKVEIALNSREKYEYIPGKSIEYFNYCLNQTDFIPVINKANPDNAYNRFIKLYKDVYDTAFPKT